MRLTVALKDAGFAVSCPKPGPDIRVNRADGPVWIEAVAPSSGEGDDAVPNPPPNTMFNYPEERIILRFRTALEEKRRRRDEYVAKGVIEKGDPYVVAISGGRMNTLMDDDDFPAILMAVYPVGPPAFFHNPRTGEGYQGRSTRLAVTKANGTETNTTCFLDSTYAGVSAVLFSEANFLMEATEGYNSFLLVHNLNARNPLGGGWLGFGRECLPVSDADGATIKIRALDEEGSA